MQTNVERAIHHRFQMIASVQRQLVVNRCEEIAAEHADPQAWMHKVFSNVAVRLDAADVEAGVKGEARAQVDLILAQLLRELTVDRDAA